MICPYCKRKIAQEAVQGSKTIQDVQTTMPKGSRRLSDKQCNDRNGNRGIPLSIFTQLLNVKHAMPDLFMQTAKDMFPCKTSVNEDQAAALVREINRLADGGMK